MYRLEEVARPAFARHETFHPRYGWFRKAVQAAGSSRDAFTKASAPVDLGVGKNMVRAIRYWGLAAKVLALGQNPQQPRLPLAAPSWNGVALFDEAGLDPYLELPGSLWLLHWWMLAPQCQLPVWWLAFHQFGPVEFSEEELLNFVTDELERSTSWPRLVVSSIKKDVDCLLRMYAARVTGRIGLDDLLDCPFRELGLIEPVWDEKKRFRFVLGPKPTLPPAVVAYACLDYLATADAGARTSTISRLAQSPGGPGRAFRLTEDALAAALEEHSREDPAIRMVSSAGVPQLSIDGDLRERSVAALCGYYRRFGRVGDELPWLSDRPAVPSTELFEEAETSALDSALPPEPPDTGGEATGDAIEYPEPLQCQIQTSGAR